MSRRAKVLLAVLGLLVVVAGGAALYVERIGIPHYPVPKVELKVEVTPERVARGQRIAGILCATCHLDPASDRLTGRKMPDIPPEFGTAYSLNITQDPAKGIGAWTDGELAFLLRTGIARDGRYTPPWMVKLPNASDEDVLSIIAFLRSDDPRVQASAADEHASEPTFLMKLLTHTVFKPFEYPRAPITGPDPVDRVATGRYLATRLFGCFACHSADFKTNDDLNPEKSAGFFGGGNAMLDANGVTVLTANITLDRETGIGKWSEDDFLSAVKGGFRPDKSPIVYPMEAYVGLTDDEARAIYAYLETVPAIRKSNPRPPAVALASDASAGKQVYFKYRCQSCHGETGVGLCDMRRTAQKYPDDRDLTDFIKHPAKTVPGSKMPAWEGVIEEQEYGPLVAYVRSLGDAP